MQVGGGLTISTWKKNTIQEKRKYNVNNKGKLQKKKKKNTSCNHIG